MSRPPNDRRRRLPALALLAALAAGGCRDEGFHRFEGVSGPDARSVAWPETPTSWRRYRGGEASRMAVLLTDTASAWLGLAHALRTAGIPFAVTTDASEATAHRVVLAYPVVSGRALDAAALERLRGHVRGGGTLIGFAVLGGAQDVFGVASATESRGRRTMAWEAEGARRFGFREAEERTVRLGAPGAAAAQLGSVGYAGGAARALARFDDGTAAVTSHRLGAGTAHAFGVDVGALALLAHGGREEGLSSSYVNGYVPTLDVFLRALGDLYRAGEPDAVTLHTVPQGREMSVVLTHDVDYAGSWEPSLAYARMEDSLGVAATYFVQTKYVRDWNDEMFFTDSTRPYLRALDSLGAELASHSVSHSRAFAGFPLGTGGERYPGYRPFVRDSTVAEGGTVMGELRVSKFLLEEVGGADSVVSFRPGELRNPYTLPQALVATGYRYSSSVTAGNSLTHLPFRLNWGRGARTELPVWEFPVTLEDEAAPPLLRRLPEALRLAESLRRYGGTYVVLIHPNAVDDKVEFQRRFVAATKPYAWFGTLAEMGTWWVARDGVAVDVRREGGRRRVRLTADGRVSGLAIRVPDGWRPLTKMGRGPRGWIVPDFLGEVSVVFEAGA
jgi:hypothetical protein